MFQIICPNCSNKNLFEKADNKPVECTFCFTTFDEAVAIEEIADEKKGILCGLKIIYQQNSEFILIKGDSCILGRENMGAEVLSDIMVHGNHVISRKHCSIHFIDGKYYLKDESSLNGTFYGANKTDCSKEAQVIENNGIIFLGKEAFLVQYQYDEPKPSEPQQTDIKSEETDKPHKYRCNEGCGFESETYYEICPKCMTCNSMVEIHEAQ